MGPSIQIITGKYKHFRLRVSSQDTLRPTSNLLRGAVFDILVHKIWPHAMTNGPCEHLRGKRVLDLCAGTGSYGFEALSRSASWVTFADASLQSIQYITENIQRLPQVPVDFSASSCTSVYHTKLPHITFTEEPFHLIFFDPPYDSPPAFTSQVLEKLAEKKLLAPECILIMEYGENAPPYHPSFPLVEERTLRRSTVRFVSYMPHKKICTPVLE